MNIKHKYKLLSMLMIVSMLMITGFSGYWLSSQMGEERNLLKEELERKLELSGDEVLDSLLLKVYIKPVLNDSMNFTITLDGTSGKSKRNSSSYETSIDHIIVEQDTLQGPGKIEKMLVKRDSPFRNGLNKIEIIHNEENHSDPSSEFEWNEEELLVRSLRLVMMHTSDSSAKDSIQFISFEDEEHVSMLRELFLKKLKKSDFNFSLEWINNNKTEKEGFSIDRLLISRQTIFPENAVIVSGVALFLLKEILPQLLFVLALLGLSFTAFLLMYQAMKKQYELNVMRQDLVSNMTHELKTPVSTMKVALEALDVFKADKDPVSAKEYTEIAKQEIDNLDNLIARILDLVSLENKGKIHNNDIVDLYGVVENCLQKLKPLIEQQEAKILVNATAESSLVEGDQWYIESAVNNILDNSLKYSGDNAVIIISIFRNEDGKLVMEVEDNGPGIAQKYSKKIFEKFFRVSTGDVHNVKGHGLGLSFAAQVMKQHGGTISQQNRKEGGSIFKLEFRL